ncbi:hypothetical protein EVAR_43818_1 [Eumeta japonica]|uniref:Uncharacterized protein n=1 Tax=Eumeta variegata TaxID=151549 RepID=A0A4C1WWZ4_EUMVA|nr:hypothetical protein EVAR_43818_1 [Eumeta japonica]
MLSELCKAFRAPPLRAVPGAGSRRRPSPSWFALAENIIIIWFWLAFYQLYYVNRVFKERAYSLLKDQQRTSDPQRPPMTMGNGDHLVAYAQTQSLRRREGLFGLDGSGGSRNSGASDLEATDFEPQKLDTEPYHVVPMALSLRQAGENNDCIEVFVCPTILQNQWGNMPSSRFERRKRARYVRRWSPCDDPIA